MESRAEVLRSRFLVGTMETNWNSQLSSTGCSRKQYPSFINGRFCNVGIRLPRRHRAERGASRPIPARQDGSTAGLLTGTFLFLNCAAMLFRGLQS